jgi:hypothetical protein
MSPNFSIPPGQFNPSGIGKAKVVGSTAIPHNAYGRVNVVTYYYQNHPRQFC